MTYYEAYKYLDDEKNKITKNRKKISITVLMLSVSIITLLLLIIFFKFLTFIGLLVVLSMYLVRYIIKFNKLNIEYKKVISVFDYFIAEHHDKIKNELINGERVQYETDEDKMKREYEEQRTYYREKERQRQRQQRTYDWYNEEDDFYYNKNDKRKWHEQQNNNSNSKSSSRKLSNDPTKNAFTLLGTTVDDDFDIIKKSYRKLAIKWHPDKFINNTKENQLVANRNMQKLNNAYALIKKRKGFN